MADSTLKIDIAGRGFALNTGGDAAKHELYKLAEKRVNEKIADYQSKTNDMSPENLLALVAFDYEIESIKSRQQTFVGSEDREKMQSIAQKLDDYLNDLSREK